MRSLFERWDAFRALEGFPIARLYLLLVTPMLLALNLVFVPFHAPDDYDHVKRAYTLAHFEIWPANLPGHSSGGYIQFGPRSNDQRPKARNLQLAPCGDSAASDRRASRNAHWATVVREKKVYSQFPGAASYLPLIYAPQAVALAVGELLHATVEDSVLAARVVNGATAVMIVFLCLAYAPYGKNFRSFSSFSFLKSLSQFASNSADPMLLALTLVIVVLVARSMIGEIGSSWHRLRYNNYMSPCVNWSSPTDVGDCVVAPLGRLA